MNNTHAFLYNSFYVQGADHILIIVLRPQLSPITIREGSKVCIFSTFRNTYLVFNETNIGLIKATKEQKAGHTCKH